MKLSAPLPICKLAKKRCEARYGCFWKFGLWTTAIFFGHWLRLLANGHNQRCRWWLLQGRQDVGLSPRFQSTTSYAEVNYEGIPNSDPSC